MGENLQSLDDVSQQAIRGKCFHPTGTFQEFDRAELEQTIPERFEEQARKYPDRLAIKTRTHQLTYDELNRAANRVGHAILAGQGARGEPVALLFQQGTQEITSLLGALKAGRVWVPVDPSLPGDRAAYILESAQPGLLVTDNLNYAVASELAGNQYDVINVDDLGSALPTDNPELSASPDDNCWIIYTSGSTGQPKGVVQTHRNVLHMMMDYTNQFHICADDRIGLLFSCSVQGGASGLFIALLNGASLYPLNIKAEGLLHLAEWLTENEVTICSTVATAFRHFASTMSGEEKFPKLRLIYLQGEPVCKVDVDIYKKHFSRDCIFVNRLGSTETDIMCTFFVDKDTEIGEATVPVGYAPVDKEILLIDDAGDVVAADEVGEIAVKSSYISPGYWQRPDLTQNAYLSGPQAEGELIYRTGDLAKRLPDGCLVHLGRKDFQVQIRGYRVEVAEVEMALLDLDAIKATVVMGRDDGTGTQRLVAYVVPAGESVPTVSELRRGIGEKLPSYMIPSNFVTLDALPTLPNGKTNRKALPEPGKGRPNLKEPFAAPRTPVEQTLAEIWAEVLDLDQVGIFDNFLDLGGDSLRAMRIISRVITTFRTEVPLQSLFEAPTVADMVLVIAQHQAKRAGDDEIERILAELEALPEAQKTQPAGE